mmetsp:Transcript_24349/g.54251  ORF Transcript_24349/g.54251 Transcript_24349/m.54251 type:complete len:204 (-) Transcript_24349:24-635(-)
MHLEQLLHGSEECYGDDPTPGRRHGHPGWCDAHLRILRNAAHLIGLRRPHLYLRDKWPICGGDLAVLHQRSHRCDDRGGPDRRLGGHVLHGGLRHGGQHSPLLLRQGCHRQYWWRYRTSASQGPLLLREPQVKRRCLRCQLGHEVVTFRFVGSSRSWQCWLPAPSGRQKQPKNHYLASSHAARLVSRAGVLHLNVVNKIELFK